ncbi:MAG: cupin domain-containing protein [Saprospiraceae bacterium]|nr:cupin domain-containing protein [Saprospiraceae bacterium]
MKYLITPLLLLCCTLAFAQDPKEEIATPDFKAFDLKELEGQMEESGRPWLPFLKVSTLSTGIYTLKVGATDRQQPHDQDEVYYVLKGKAKFEAGGEKSNIKEGSILFVKAKVPHRFYEIEQDLQVLVFFSAAEEEEK